MLPWGETESSLTPDSITLFLATFYECEILSIQFLIRNKSEG